ncbi:hypothetical protein [Natrinema caseinilyticum]|uniref:hypothetical protein n=1 Tax=Natrinema caseinilyticum TaxID=2961570 RepID=UPI0020C595B7|nr:hypothetical protein [Natrinema caseinilyticum]
MRLDTNSGGSGGDEPLRIGLDWVSRRGERDGERAGVGRRVRRLESDDRTREGRREGRSDFAEDDFSYLRSPAGRYVRALTGDPLVGVDVLEVAH